MIKAIQKLALMVMTLCLMAPITSFAGEWQQNNKGWWVQNDDGTYLTNQWYQSPESGLYYYLGADGYMLCDTITPDGFYVNTNGVWEQQTAQSQPEVQPTESSNSTDRPEGVTEQEWQEWLELEKLLEERGKKQVVNEITIYPGEAGYDNTGHINIGG